MNSRNDISQEPHEPETEKRPKRNLTYENDMSYGEATRLIPNFRDNELQSTSRSKEVEPLPGIARITT